MAVQNILEELEYHEIPQLLVYNKGDQLDEDQRIELLAGGDAIGISALKRQGLDELLTSVEGQLPLKRHRTA